MRHVILAAAACILLAGCSRNDSDANLNTNEAHKTKIAAPKKDWKLVDAEDRLTDEKKRMAIWSGSSDHRDTSLVVRCIAQKLEVVVSMGEYLGSESAKVRYRFDKNALQSESWTPSTSGNALFARHPADFARQIAKSKSLVVEADDFRSTPHRVEALWIDDGEDVLSVLDACSVRRVGLAEMIPGLERESALEMERWGPKFIESQKIGLASVAGFKGSINQEIDPEFALAAQQFRGEYVSNCRAGRLKGDLCTSMRVLDGAKLESSPPFISSVIYERSPSKLKKVSGHLRVFD